MKKQPVVEYLQDSFVDFKGNTRKFIICAVSSPYDGTVESTDGDRYDWTERALTIGISVCSEQDEFDEELGKKIAHNRATNEEHNDGALYSTNPGYINSKVVRALLEQEAEYFKNNPQSRILGYLEQKRKYEDAQFVKAMDEKLTLTDRAIIDFINNPDADLVKYAKLTKNK